MSYMVLNCNGIPHGSMNAFLRILCVILIFRIKTTQMTIVVCNAWPTSLQRYAERHATRSLLNQHNVTSASIVMGRQLRSS